MPEFWQTICPIWFRVSGGYELEGSGVLMKIGSHRFLLTAAHVVDRANGLSAYVGLPGGYVELSGVTKATTPPSGKRDEDRVDLAFIALDAPVANAVETTYAFLPLSCVDVMDEGFGRTPYMVNGCPARKVKKDGRTFRPALYELQVTGRAHEEYATFGVTPWTHIAMEFDRKKMTDGLGRGVASPKLGGVSGGPVWKGTKIVQPDGSSAMTKRLVGIIIEHSEAKRTLVATRISGALGGIGHAFPDIAALIPKNPSLDIICRDTQSSG